MLKSLSNNLDSIIPIYEIAKEAKNLILNKKYSCFVKLINEAWDLKRHSDENIIKNKKLIKLDNELQVNEDVVAHKLLGAGSGGNYLIVTKKNVKLKYKKLYKVDVS